MTPADSARNGRVMNPEAGNCLLFVYGLLQPDFKPPRTMKNHWKDRVRGKLFDLGRYPAAIAVGKSDTWIHGWVLDISDAELVELDDYEDVDEGLYERIRTVTDSGYTVWIYSYSNEIPQSARGPISCWPEPA